MVEAEHAQWLCFRGRRASARSASRAALGLGIPPGLDLGNLATHFVRFRCVNLPAVGLDNLVYLSIADATSDVSRHGRVPRARDKKLFSSTWPFSGRMGADTVHAGPPAEPRSSSNRV